MRNAILALVALTAALVLLAGCGGGSSTAASGQESAATLVPAGVALFASIDSDLDSSQWNQLEELLDRFPGRDMLVAQLRAMLAEEDISAEQLQEALGPNVDVAVTDFAGGDPKVVAFTKPDDRQALDGVLGEDQVTKDLDDGWVAFSDDEAAITALTGQSGETLADDDRFTEAMGELPGEALAKVYVNGEAATQGLESFGGGAGLPQGSGKLLAASLAAVAEDDGLGLQFFTKTEGGAQPPDVGELLEDVPEDVIAFVNFGLGDQEEALREGMRGVPGAGQALEQFEQALGVSLADLTALLSEEAILYVRPGALIPEVTLVAKADEDRGGQTVDRVLRAIAQQTGGQVQTSEVAGVQVTEANLGQVSVYATAYDGRVVVTTLKKGIEDLRSDGDKLGDDERYEDAVDAAGVADGEDVLLYVDIDEAYGLVERLAQLAGQPVPPDVRGNVEPLRAVVASADVSEDESSGRLFVALD